MTCTQCQKPEDLCVCTAIAPVTTRLATVILQHPQEQAEDLGTGWLAHCQLKNSVLRVGLSWPSLKRVLGNDTVEMKRWGVLFLGAAKEAPRPDEPEVLVLGRKGERLPDAAPIIRSLHGIILIDGTWGQAKSLWWRNPWLLKAHRLVLNPPARSGYGKLRREPRRESLAVIEAAAFALARLDRRPELEALILKPFTLLVEKIQLQQKAARMPATEHNPERKIVT
ncbi:MAG: tRNA-uridine aminocarboxypropyltransferase [Rhodospirillaceae bacterium]